MNQPPPIPAFPSEPAPHWSRALGGIWRLTWRRAVAPASLGLLGGLAGLLGLLTYTGVKPGSAENFHSWSVSFWICFVVPVFAFLSTSGLIQDDMTPATVDYVFTRSVRRWVFVGLRFLSHQGCLQLQCLAALGVLGVIGMVRHVPGLGGMLAGLAGVQLLAVLAFGALGLVLGVLTARPAVAGLIYAGVVELGVGNIPTSVNRLSMLHQVRVLAPGAEEGESAAVAVAVLLVFSLLAIVLAASVFSFRETAGAKPRDT